MLLLSIEKKVIIHILFLLLICTGLEGGKRSLENSGEGSNKVPRQSMLSSDDVSGNDLSNDDGVAEKEGLLYVPRDVGLHYRCDSCENKYFTTKEGLNYHQKSVHEGVRYQCDQCEKSYFQKKDFRVHKKTVHEGISYQCNECEKNYFSKRALDNHNKTVHEGSRFECNKCEKSYCHQRDLKSHKKSVHEGVRYQCDQCIKTYVYERSLNVHKKIAHEGKLFKCGQCEKFYSCQASLDRHKKSVYFKSDQCEGFIVDHKDMLFCHQCDLDDEPDEFNNDFISKDKLDEVIGFLLEDLEEETTV